MHGDSRRRIILASGSPRRRALAEAAAASVIAQAARGLAYAHGQGLVHRDVCRLIRGIGTGSAGIQWDSFSITAPADAGRSRGSLRIIAATTPLNASPTAGTSSRIGRGSAVIWRFALSCREPPGKGTFPVTAK